MDMNRMIENRLLENRPRLLLAYSDSAYASSVARQLRRSGWEVHLASNAEETCRLVQSQDPSVVLLDVDLPDETGWLTCAKLTLDRPELHVWLLSEGQESLAEGRAQHVGAQGLIARTEGPEAVLSALIAEVVTA